MTGTNVPPFPVEITCSAHARLRMQKRGVTEKDVEGTLRKPDIVMPQHHDGSQEVRRRVGQKMHFVVFARIGKNRVLLITTGWSGEK